MNNTSLVSICIPTYNSAKYLPPCLDSIAAQTYKNVEVLISDNASTDATVSIIKEYVDKYAFKLDINSVNIGGSLNFHKLLRWAKGTYIVICHSDDVYEDNFIEEAVSVFDSDISIGLVGTMGNIINEAGVPFNSMRLPKHLEKLNKMIYTFDEALSGIVKRGWFFVTPSIMIRKDVVNELGMFELNKYGSAGDYEYWLRVASKYKVAIINKKLIRYRVHKEQSTEKDLRRNPEVADIVLVITKYKEMTANKKVRRWCEDCINANIITAARRQNYYGLFEKSNETLKAMKSKKILFLIQKYGIRLFNLFQISIKKRTLSAMQSDKPL